MPALLETIDAVFLPKLNSHLAARLGESINAVRRGLQAGMAVVLHGLAMNPVEARGQYASESGFCLVELSRQPQATLTCLLVIVGSKEVAGSPMAQGQVLLTTLFGPARQVLVGTLSDYAGLKPESARALLELLAGVLPMIIGQFAARQKLTAEATAAALQSAAEQMRARMPRESAGMSEVLGLRNARTVSWESIQAVVQDVTTLRSGLLVRWHGLMMAGLAVGSLGLGMAFLGSDSARSAAQAPSSGDMIQRVESVTTLGRNQAPVLQRNY